MTQRVQPVKVMFFDLYETLVTQVDPDWRPLPQTIAQRLGIDDAAFHAHWSHMNSALDLGEIRDYSDALRQVCIAAGSTPDPLVLDQLTEEYRSEIARAFETVESEIVAMIEALKRSGFTLAIITNANILDAEPWTGSILAQYFDDFLASHEIGLVKRDRRIFDLACQRLAINPDEAIFIGDGGGNELTTAREAGINPLWCSWFLDRWPEGRRPNGFPGDDWRQYDAKNDALPFERLREPSDLLHHRAIRSISTTVL